MLGWLFCCVGFLKAFKRNPFEAPGVVFLSKEEMSLPLFVIHELFFVVAVVLRVLLRTLLVAFR